MTEGAPLPCFALMKEDEMNMRQGIENILQGLFDKSSVLDDELAELQTFVSEAEQRNQKLKEKLSFLKNEHKECQELDIELQRLKEEDAKYKSYMETIKAYEFGDYSRVHIS